MKTTITTQNFESMKYKMLLCVSKYGKMMRPEQWYTYLSIYDFENESVVDMVTSYLINEYTKK